MKKELRIYCTKDGKAPFTQWMDSLKDNVVKAQVTNRLNRLMQGNCGDCEPVGEGVSELRIHYGAGYRIYFVAQERTVIVLLTGGSKKTQSKDIQQAKKYWKELRDQCYD